MNNNFGKFESKEWEMFTCDRSVKSFRNWIDDIFKMENPSRAGRFKSHLPDAFLGVQVLVKRLIHEKRCLNDIMIDLKSENDKLKSHLIGLADEALAITSEAYESPHVKEAMRLKKTNHLN